MTISRAYQREATELLSGKLPIVDPNTGLPTTYLLRLFQALRDDTLGAARLIPCSASGTNVLTLTPNEVSPLLQGYRDYDGFIFVAVNDSTGAVTATVAPKIGTLATLKVYIDDGATQAGSGDVVADCLYIAFFADHLDSGAGGLVLK